MAKQKRPRNFHACHPIMRKGGVHEKSKSAIRAASKRETRRKTSEWLVGPHSIITLLIKHTEYFLTICLIQADETR